VEATTFIRSGWVRYTTLGYSLGYSGPGGHFGEVALLEMPSQQTAAEMGISTIGLQRSSRNWLCVEAMTALEVMQLPQDKFHEVLPSFSCTWEQLRMAALQRVRLFNDEGVSNLLGAIEKAYRRQERAAREEEEAAARSLAEQHAKSGVYWRHHPKQWAQACGQWTKEVMPWLLFKARHHQEGGRTRTGEKASEAEGTA